MTLGLYLPLKLNEQIDSFKNASGNVNIDYRSSDNGDIKILNTPYTRVNSPATISLNCFPLEAVEDHISGYNQLFKEFPIDVILENMSGEQRHYFYTTNNNPIIEVTYLYSESQRVGSTSYMYHYYSFKDPSITPSYFTGKTIKPCVFSSEKINTGLINTRDCLALTSLNVPITLTSGLLKITEEVPEIVDNNLNVPLTKVNNKFACMQSIIVSDGTATKTSSKFRLIAIAKEDGSVNGSPVLTARLSNYNLYYLDTELPSYTPDAISFPLKGGEKAIFNTVITNNSENYIGVLSSTLLSFSELYAPEVGRSFGCFRFKLPELPYVDSSNNPKTMKISLDDGNTWTSFKNYSVQDENLFRTDLIQFFKDNLIKCYPCENRTFILQNTGPISNKFLVQYHPEFYIESIIDSTTINTLDGISLIYNPLSFPENLSPCRVNLYGKDGPSEAEDPEYVEYAFRLPAKQSSESISDLFKSTLYFTTNKTELISTIKYNYYLNNEVKEKTVNFSTETVETILDKVVIELNSTITNATFLKVDEKITVVSKDNSFIDFGLTYQGLSLDDSSNLLKETISAVPIYLLRGS